MNVSVEPHCSENCIRSPLNALRQEPPRSAAGGHQRLMTGISESKTLSSVGQTIQPWQGASICLYFARCSGTYCSGSIWISAFTISAVDFPKRLPAKAATMAVRASRNLAWASEWGSKTSRGLAEMTFSYSARRSPASSRSSSGTRDRSIFGRRITAQA